MSYEIDVSVESPCVAEENGMCVSIKDGPRRVRNVLVGGEEYADPYGQGRIVILQAEKS